MWYRSVIIEIAEEVDTLADTIACGIGMEGNLALMRDAALRDASVRCPECGMSGFIRIPSEEYGDPHPVDWQKCDCHWGRQACIEPPGE